MVDLSEFTMYAQLLIVGIQLTIALYIVGKAIYARLLRKYKNSASDRPLPKQ